MVLVLAAVVVVQSWENPVAVVAVVVFAAAFVGGRLLVHPAVSVSAPRGRWWPDGAWILALTLAWLVVLVTAETPAIWLAFPLMLLQLHVLGPRPGVPAVAATTIAAVAAGLTFDLAPVGAVLGPVLGGTLVVAVIIGLETVLRESEARQQLIDELVATRHQLAEAEHERGISAERVRLAREIHDTLAQGLSSIELLLRVAEETGDDSQVRRAREVARENLVEVRQFVRGLAPADLAGSTLEEALERIVGRTDIAASHWSVSGEPRDIPVATSAALVRVAQSTLANVERHAGATRVDVTLSYLEGSVLLDVVDDGVGFDPTQAGFGLGAMRSRVEELGGRAVVESAPGRGTAVAVEVPT